MINIGITVNIIKPTESFFSNGITQNVITLRTLLLKTGIVDNVYYVNIGQQKDLSQSPWKQYEAYIIDVQDCFDKINLLISAGAFLNGKLLEQAKNKNIKMVVHLMGNEYYLFNERILFGNEKNGYIRKNLGYDAVWISPHLYETNKDLWEVMTEVPAYVAPYIWSPQFINPNMQLYKPSDNVKKRINVMESNLTMVKTSTFPMIVLEKLYNKYPNDIERSMIFGAQHLVKNYTFNSFASSLNICKAAKISFENRYAITTILNKHTDIVLSHQRDCELNYLYFDAAWFGYPVVHNSSFVKELGWYYGTFEADKAVELLHDIVMTFDKSQQKREEYLIKSREFISQYLPEHERNVEGYKALLEKLFFSIY
jgi:hypothetical protein